MTVLVETTSSVPKSNRPHEIPCALGRGGLLLSYVINAINYLFMELNQAIYHVSVCISFMLNLA